MAADYKVYQPVTGKLTRIYGGNDNDDVDFPAEIKIDLALLNKGNQIELNEPFLAYITRGNGFANGEQVGDGDLIRGDSIKFEATENVQLIIVHKELT